jgi:hypothetical protein
MQAALSFPASCSVPSAYRKRNDRGRLHDSVQACHRCSRSGGAGFSRRHGRGPAECPYRDLVAGRRASRAIRPGLFQAGRFDHRRQGQVPGLPRRHNRQPAQDYRVGAEEGGAGWPFLARLRLGSRQDRGDLRRLCRVAAGRGAAALDLCRRRHGAVAAVAHGEVQRRGARSTSWRCPAARTPTKFTCTRASPSVRSRT